MSTCGGNIQRSGIALGSMRMLTRSHFDIFISCVGAASICRVVRGSPGESKGPITDFAISSCGAVISPGGRRVPNRKRTPDRNRNRKRKSSDGTNNNVVVTSW